MRSLQAIQKDQANSTSEVNQTLAYVTIGLVLLLILILSVILFFMLKKRQVQVH